MRRREFDYDDILRRALRTAADGIEPSGDGLERIRARLTTPRPLAAAWLMAGYTDVVLPALTRLSSTLASLRVWLRPGAGQSAHTRAGYRHLAPGPALVRRYGWLRPAAVAAAIVIMVAGGFALTQLPGAISNSGAENLPLSNNGTHPHGGSVNSSAASQFPGPSKTSGVGPGIMHPSPSASATCSPSPKRRGSGSHLTPPKPTPSRTATPAPTVTPSPTATASPTPTDTGTPSPTPTSTGVPATLVASPALSPAGIVPPPAKPVDAAASPSPSKKSTLTSSPPCRSGR